MKSFAQQELTFKPLAAPAIPGVTLENVKLLVELLRGKDWRLARTL